MNLGVTNQFKNVPKRRIEELTMDFSIKKNWKRRLLTVENAKTTKGESLKFLTGILYLAAHRQSEAFGGGNICQNASAGCSAHCLMGAGRGRFEKVRDARIAKTVYFFRDRKSFLNDLRNSVKAIERKASRMGFKAAVRFNGTGDLPIEKFGIIEEFPDVQWYDYTKSLKRALAYARGEMPKNYHLTFSKSEDNDESVKELLPTNVNIAVVFKGGILPQTYLGRPVVDCDLHDLRFLDQKGIICGLKAKGPAKKDDSGFVVDALAA